MNTVDGLKPRGAGDFPAIQLEKHRALWVRCFALLPIPVFFIAIGALARLRIQTAWNPPLLLPALNIVLLAVVSFLVSILAARSYRVEQSSAVLFLGCGTLALGLGALAAGLSLGGPGQNAIIAVYATAACLAGFCHLASAIGSLPPRPQRLRQRRPYLPGSYLSIVLAVSFLVLLVRRGTWPIHFIEGTGETIFGFMLVWTTAGLFAFSAILLGINHRARETDFRRWYALGLGLIAAGLAGVSLQTRFGDPLTWVGRSAQYLGGLYMLIAMISLIRQSGTWMLPVERALRESEDRLHRFIAANPIGVFHWATEKGILDANDRFLEMVGYSREDLHSGRMRWSSISIADSHRRDLEALAEFRTTGRNTPYERVFIRKDGSLAPILLSSVAVDDMCMEGIAFALDLSEQKQAEAVLLKSRDELEMRVRERTAELISANKALQEQAALMDLAHDAILIRDPEGRIVYWNEGASRTYGWTKEEALGKLTESLLPAVSSGSQTTVDALLMKDGQWEGELSHVTKDGSSVVVASRQVLLRDQNGNPRSILVINRDIMERKQAEEKLRDHAARLESLNAELQEFAFVASHDLQEPLRKIQAFGERMRSRHADSLDDTGKDYLLRMERAAKRMQTLLAALLDYSRVATTVRPWEQADLMDVARGVVEDLEVAIQKCDARVEIGELPSIEADAIQMRQLFQNLISNSLKYCREDEKTFVRVRGRLAEKKVEILVEDNGIGFEEKHLSRIFKPFQRLHPHTEYEGTGMGLAICRKIVERHAGSITARSTPGKGSTFIVTLPATQTGSK